MNKLGSFKAVDVNIVQTEHCHSGFFQVDKLSLQHKLFAGGWSATLQREVFLREEAVGVLLFDPRLDVVVLVEQFRIGAQQAGDDPWLLEIVAGILEPGENPRELAHRESMEEAGCSISHLEDIYSYLCSPGGSSEKLTLLLGITDASQAGGLHGLESEGEDIRVHVLPTTEALQLMGENKLNNAATIVALQWLQLNHQRLCSIV